jgi:ABC-type uncharacterized transport system auxiliary subunit
MKKILICVAVVLVLAGCKEQPKPKDDFANKCHAKGGVVRVVDGKKTCHILQGPKR